MEGSSIDNLSFVSIDGLKGMISVNKDKKSYGLAQRRLTSLSLRRRHCSLLRRTICTLRKLGRRASSQGSRHWIQSTFRGTHEKKRRPLCCSLH
uniref:Uncharacterized protein n=1 Tax=Brassica campestris TaxID=3711 RepID=A0A3P6BA70_BRACM|nr:unnamed protein product [Brassica rapa]